MRDVVAEVGEREVAALAHEHVQDGVEHVVEQHEDVGQRGQRRQSRPRLRAQPQVQRRRQLGIKRCVTLISPRPRDRFERILAFGSGI